MERKPFTIRAHHLIKTNYYFLEAIQDLNQLEQYLNIDNDMLLTEHNEFTDKTDMEYVRDLLGNYPKEYIKEYLHEIMKYFTYFASSLCPL